jgi:hypothetical protein
MRRQGNFEYWIIVNKAKEKALNYSGMWSESLTNVKKYINEQLAEIDAERVDGTVARYTGQYIIE